MDYKKKYADYYKISWNPVLFDVHHIDRNRENNDIKNLVLVPKILHRRYHFSLNVIQSDFKDFEDIWKIDNDTDMFNCQHYIHFFEAKTDMITFCKIKKSLELYDVKNSRFEDILKNYYFNIYKKYVC